MGLGITPSQMSVHTHQSKRIYELENHVSGLTTKLDHLTNIFIQRDTPMQSIRAKEEKRNAQLKKVEPESSKLYDLDPETRQTMEKMMELPGVTKQEAFKTSQISRPDTGTSSKSIGGQALGVVISTSLNPMRSVEGAAQSSIAVNKSLN